MILIALLRFLTAESFSFRQKHAINILSHVQYPVITYFPINDIICKRSADLYQYIDCYNATKNREQYSDEKKIERSLPHYRNRSTPPISAICAPRFHEPYVSDMYAISKPIAVSSDQKHWTTLCDASASIRPKNEEKM